MGGRNLKENMIKKNLKSEIYYIYDKNNKNTEVVFSFFCKIFPDDKKVYYFPLIKKLLTGGMQSILMKRLRVQLHIIYNIQIYIDTNVLGTIITIETTVKNNKTSQLIREVKKMLTNLVSGKLNMSDLNRVKDVFQIIKDTECWNPVNLGNFYGHQFITQIYKKNPIIVKHTNIKKMIMKVTKKDIIQMCREMFQLDKCLIIYQSPKKMNKTRKNFTF